MDPVSENVPVVLPDYSWQPPPKFRDRIWLHVALLVLTILSTTFVGEGHYLSFATDFGVRRLDLSDMQLFVRGLWYSGTILAILGTHEMGHYIACRYYDVDASLPYFLPMPFFLTGTLGAVIRIKEPIPSKRMLFDIGIAGPIAGFAVAVPALFIGLWLSHISTFPPNIDGFELGEPLLFKAATWALFGTVGDGLTVNLHPMAFAAWFGLLATALNLFPIGQLDGGHISYAVLGRRSSVVTLVTLGFAVVLIYFSMSWAVWAGLTILMLWRFGHHHPRTFDEQVPLDPVRLWLAVFAVVMFILCFTPAPVSELHQLVR